MGRFLFVSLGLLIMALSLREVKSSCPFEWLAKKEFCYKLFDIVKNWNDAEMFCRKHKPGCHLVSIHSKEESVDLAEYASGYLTKKVNVWIGLNSPEKNDKWEWSNRSKVDYLAWMKKKPDNFKNSEYCGELELSTKYLSWNDQRCSRTAAFICQCNF